MNKNEIARNEIEKGISIAVKKAIEPYEKQFTNGIILSSGTIEGYKIKVDGVIYDNVLRLNSLTFNINDVVIVVYPNGNKNNMFILGKLG